MTPARGLLLALAVLLLAPAGAQASEFDYLPELAKRTTVAPSTPAVVHGAGWRARRRVVFVDVRVDGREHPERFLAGAPDCKWSAGTLAVPVIVDMCGRVARITASSSSGRHRLLVRWTFHRGVEPRLPRQR